MRLATPLLRAVTWIDARLGDFRIEHTSTALFATLKAITELAHAADYLHRATDSRCRAAGERFMDFAWSQVQRGELFQSLIATDPRLVPLGIGFLPFHLFGHRCAALQRTLAAQLAVAQLDDLSWTLTVPVMHTFGIATTAEMNRRAQPLSVLHNQTEPSRLPQDAVYLLAHECLYAADWGHHAPRYARKTAAYVAAALPALIEQHRDIGDADVLAELLLAHRASQLPALADAVWQPLEDAQTDAGNVVPTQPLRTIFPRLVHPRLQRTYHTTLVSIMAWSTV